MVALTRVTNYLLHIEASLFLVNNATLAELSHGLSSMAGFSCVFILKPPLLSMTIVNLVNCKFILLKTVDGNTYS